MAVTYQKTLAKDASLVGTSLHTGKKVKLTMKPAPPGTGIVFRRKDLDDEPTVPANVESVNKDELERKTTLSVGGVKVHTVEHVLSALRGMGVDNACLEMDANEPPIGDGSAEPFVKMIESAGVEDQEAPRQSFELKEPLCVQGKNGSYISAFPHDGFKISCTSSADQTQKFTQYLSLEITPESYRKELASARTFVFAEEIQALMDKGLAQGGSLENAIVIQGDHILSKDPLRYEDEFVRHKMLDMVADFSLFPMPVKAHVLAARPSHALNAKFAAELAKAYRRYLHQLMPVEHIPYGESALDVQGVMKILPHRYPFLLVDRVLKFEGDKAVGVKTVTINEPFFQGHFPTMPVMPGVLQVEAMAQVASILMLRKAENAGKLGLFMSIDKVKFRKPVLPGDILFMHVELVRSRGKIGKAVGKCLVNDEVVSEGELMFALE